MDISILIPHFRNGKVTAVAISKILEHSKRHNVEIIVIDNGPEDGSIKYLLPFSESITIINKKDGYLSSHGIAFDQVLNDGKVSNDWFITMESDSFPVDDYWIDYFENAITFGFECAGSHLTLSGGTYIHPCGTLYKKSNWELAKKYCNSIDYTYFPNMAMKDGFASHLMIHNSIINDVLYTPDDYIELSSSYVGLSKEEMLNKAKFYSSTNQPFHNGMGKNNESVKTYGHRTLFSEAGNVILDNKRKLIFRVGAEPGQWFSWWHYAGNHRIKEIPTETKWIDGKENIQQEYTLSEAGVKHIWAGTAYKDMKDTSLHDVYLFKEKYIDDLYNSLPEYQKIK